MGAACGKAGGFDEAELARSPKHAKPKVRSELDSLRRELGELRTDQAQLEQYRQLCAELDKLRSEQAKVRQEEAALLLQQQNAQLLELRAEINEMQHDRDRLRVLRESKAERPAKKRQGTKKPEKKLVFHIGTNNWQRQGEFAPGSGILHASMHGTFNSMPGVKCYSIYPSRCQTDPAPGEDQTFRVFRLDHDIPICESVSPSSNYRWHSMSDAEFGAYRRRLEDEVCAYMDEVEKQEGKEFDFLVSHHAFTNAMAGAQVLERRRKSGNRKLKHFNFVHGTALKMYIKEREGDPEYPMRFLKLCQDHGCFSGTSKTAGVWVNSEDYIGKFAACFPKFPRKNLVFSRIGVNQKIFRPRHTTVESDLARHVRPEDAGRLGAIRRVATFVGKFADWKRLDAVLHAAAVYEKAFPDLGTVVVGSGPPEAVDRYEGLAKELKLERTLFVGAKGQDVLAELFSMSEVGMFPSYKEPFGMVFIECMACGTPTIGCNSGGPTEFVRDAQGVLIDEEPDWQSEAGIRRLGGRLATAVARALDEDWKHESKGPTCVGFVRAQYSTLAQCESMLADMESW